MQEQMLGHGVLAMATLTALMWSEAIPAHLVLHAAEMLLLWAGLTTLLVGIAGAWVALGRARRPAPVRAGHGSLRMQRVRPGRQ